MLGDHLALLLLERFVRLSSFSFSHSLFFISFVTFVISMLYIWLQFTFFSNSCFTFYINKIRWIVLSQLTLKVLNFKFVTMKYIFLILEDVFSAVSFSSLEIFTKMFLLEISFKRLFCILLSKSIKLFFLKIMNNEQGKFFKWALSDLQNLYNCFRKYNTLLHLTITSKHKCRWNNCNLH